MVSVVMAVRRERVIACALSLPLHLGKPTVYQYGAIRIVHNDGDWHGLCVSIRVITSSIAGASDALAKPVHYSVYGSP